MPAKLTAAQQVQRFTQFCVWLRLDLRYEHGPWTKGIARTTPVEALRYVLDWSWRQATGLDKQSRFSNIGKTRIAPKTAVGEVIRWVRDKAEEPPEVARPFDLDNPAAFEPLIRNWQYYLLGPYDDEVDALRPILDRLASLHSPLRDLMRAAESPELLPQYGGSLGDAETGSAVPGIAATHLPDLPSALQGQEVRGKWSALPLARRALALALLATAAATSWAVSERQGPPAAQVKAVKTVKAVATPKASASDAPNEPAAAPSSQRAGSDPVYAGADASAVGSNSTADELLRFSLMAEAGGQVFEVGPDAPLPSRTRFSFRLQPNRLLHVVLCEFRADGTLHVLFPSDEHDHQQSWPLAAHVVQELPPPEAGTLLRLDDTPGEERLLILAATVPLGKKGLSLESALAAVLWRADWAPRPAFARNARASSSPRPITRGVDVVYSDSQPSSQTPLVVARFVSIRHVSQ